MRAFLFLGVVFKCPRTLWNLFVAWSTAHIVGRANRYAIWINRAVGGVFVAVGIELAFNKADA